MINQISARKIMFGASNVSNENKNLTDGQEKLGLEHLTNAERVELSNQFRQAKNEYVKSYPKASAEEKESVETHFKTQVFTSLSNLITKKIPAAAKSALPDWQKLFSGYDSIHTDLKKAKRFNDLSEEAQYKLIDTIAEGLASQHEEVRKSALEMGESLGLDQQGMEALRASKLNPEEGSSVTEASKSNPVDNDVSTKSSSKKMKSTWA